MYNANTLKSSRSHAPTPQVRLAWDYVIFHSEGNWEKYRGKKFTMVRDQVSRARHLLSRALT